MKLVILLLSIVFSSLVSNYSRAELIVTPRAPVAAAVANQFLTSISASGATTLAQPSCSNLSGVAASCSTDATNAANISSGTLPAGRMPALTGDVTTSSGAVATTLATVNSNTGSFGDSTHVPAITVNGKGLITAVTSTLINGSVTPGSYYWSGYYPASGANTWITTSATPATNMTVAGTIPTPTQWSGANITVAKATSSLPGINIASAPRSGVLEVIFKVQIAVVSGTTPTGAINLVETVNSTAIDAMGFFLAATSISGETQTLTLSGFVPVTLGNAYNFILQGYISSGTLYIGGYSITGSMLTMSIKYIN
jgi:hypothetical protein